MTSEEIAQSAADLATVETLRARILEWEDCYDRLSGAFDLHLAIGACHEALSEYAGGYYDVVLGEMAAQSDFWRVQAADVLLDLHAAERERDAMRACLADALGFAWMAHRTDFPKYVADVRQRANELIRQESTDAL